MNDSDVLARAAKALREAHTGERTASGFTRARIMNTLHRERRRRILRWAVFSPLVSLLLVGSAWAQSTGSWPVIWRAVSAVFSAAPQVPESRAPERRPRSVERPAADPSPPAPPSAREPDLEPVKAPEPPAAEALPSPAPRPPRSRPPRPAPRASTPRPEPAPLEAPAAARELALFRTAHDLHFRGDHARQAIAAYEAYLREYPRGRFVPEARYNAALDHIKLGESDAARAALAPFAAGEYGGYRQKEARELLDALR